MKGGGKLPLGSYEVLFLRSIFFFFFVFWGGGRVFEEWALFSPFPHPELFCGDRGGEGLIQLR